MRNHVYVGKERREREKKERKEKKRNILPPELARGEKLVSRLNSTVEEPE